MSSVAQREKGQNAQIVQATVLQLSASNNRIFHHTGEPTLNNWNIIVQIHYVITMS